MIAAADARGDSAFIPGSSLCRPRNLDLSQVSSPSLRHLHGLLPRHPFLPIYILHTCTDFDDNPRPDCWPVAGVP